MEAVTGAFELDLVFCEMDFVDLDPAESVGARGWMADRVAVLGEAERVAQVASA